MLIWSVMPSQIIWEAAEGSETIKALKLTVSEIAGVKVLVEPLNQGKGRIRQVLSTAPEHFLRGELAPGTIVNLV